MQHTEAATASALVQKAAPLLRRGYVSTIEMDQYQANALNAQSQIKELERQRLDAEQQRSQLHPIEATVVDNGHHPACGVLSL